MTKEEIKQAFAIECTETNSKGVIVVKGTPMDIINWINDKLDQETQRLKAELAEKDKLYQILDNKVAILQSELTELKEKHKRDVVGFAEYISGLCISNYKSGGSWYLNGGKIVTTDKLLEQYYNETHKTK